MKILIRESTINLELPQSRHREIDWEALLDELKAEHLPGRYRPGERMALTITSHGVWICIYRTDKTPTEPAIREILKRHGLEGD
jgi:hypothetical protein